MHAKIVATLLFAAGVWLQGCGADRSRDRPRERSADTLPQPAVRKLGSVTLTESDTAYLGRPAALSVDPVDGSLYVSDAFWGRVLRFSAAGELERSYGRRGEGPGELRSPGAVEVVDTTVVVLDEKRLTRYRRADGGFLGSARFGGVLTSMQALGGRLWLGGLNVDRRTSLGTWAPGEQIVRPAGTIPSEFTQSEPLAGIYTGVEVAAWGDTVLAGYEGLNRLTLFRGDGTPIRSFRVPVRARRGELPNIVEAMQRLDFPGQFSANSVLFRLERLPSGNFALVHCDQTIDGQLITARVYLTLLSADAQPYTAFRGDTLYVVQQEVKEERSRTFVDRYLIDERACPGDGAGIATLALGDPDSAADPQPRR
jgi:hypothetical protein